MLWHSLGIEMWFVVVVSLAGALGRGAKALWSTMPPWGLQAVVVVGSYAIVFGDLAAHVETPLVDDARLALWAVAAAGTAIGGHEILKKQLALLLGLFIKDEARVVMVAEVLLGKLQEQAKPPATKRATATQALLVMVLALALTGCAALTSVLAKAAHYASYVTAVVDEIERRVDAADLPETDKAKAAQGIEITRRAVRALQASSTAADADQAGDVAARERAVLEAFRELHGIVAPLGVLGDELGAGEVDVGGIPTPAQLEARL